MNKRRTRTRLLLLSFLLVLTALIVALSDPFNTPPIFLAPTETDVIALTQQDFALDVRVKDVDGDQLSVQVYNLPDWLSFDPYNMRLEGKPDIVDKGEYFITIKVDDGRVLRSKMVHVDVNYGHTAKQHLNDALLYLWQSKLEKLPGFSVAMMTPDGVLNTVVNGHSDWKRKKPLTTDSRFRIASVSKLVTSTLVVRLAEEGYLSLDDPIAKYLPIERIPYGKSISIRQVLSHTAGIVDHLNHGAFYRGNWKYRTWSSNDIINFAAGRKARFKPGKGYDYSNTGYYFLGLLIEKILDQPLGEAYQEWIFEPSGMSQSIYDDFSTRKKRIPQLAENSRAYEYHQSAVGAAGAIISTPADLARFGHALYTGKLVSEASLKEMTTDIASKLGGDHYGLGMRLWDDHGITHQGHSGLLMGYRTILMYLPEYKVTLAFATNHSIARWYDLVNGTLIEMADYYH